jgi:hypothetical protein
MHTKLSFRALSLMLFSVGCGGEPLDTAGSTTTSSTTTSEETGTKGTTTETGGSTTETTQTVPITSTTTTTTPPDLVDIRINEIQASNMDGILDGEGETSDWIELRNFSEEVIDLSGFGLTDDAADPFQYVFSTLVLQPGELSLVFANGTEQGPWLSLDTVVDIGDTFAFATPDQANMAWYLPTFDDAEWALGESPFGYGDGDDATEVVDSAVFARIWFDVDAAMLADTIGARLSMDYDDSFVAYLNGVEIARNNIGTAGEPVNPNAFATVGHEALLYQGLPLETFDIEQKDIEALLQEGANLLSVAAFNVKESSSDMTLLPVFSLGRTTAGVGSSSELVGTAGFAAAFSLDAHGETVTLSNAEGYALDAVDYGRLYADESLGRSLDGAEWLWFQESTPNLQNGTLGLPEVAQSPVVSPPGGIVKKDVTVEITVPDGAYVTYTLNSAEPTESSALYTKPITLTVGQDALVLRTRAFKENAWPSQIETTTWFTDPFNLPTWSIVTEPENLWSPVTGIYDISNVWQNWERPVHLEFYEADGTLSFKTDAGIKIHGGASRSFDQKSLRLLARSGYGDAEFDYAFFPDTDVTSFKRLILRNGSHDWCYTMVRDPVTHALVRDQDVDRQGYRPSRAFINGEYWGIYNIREKQDKHYVASHHGEDPDDLDILEYDGTEVNEGDSTNYFEFLNYADQNDLSDPKHYAWVQERMDVAEFIEYVIIETFVSNYDWPGNNIQFWRPRRDGGLWRWTLYDTESGYGNWGISSSYDMIAHTTNSVGSAWPNGAWSTQLFRSLLDSEEFLHLFANRYAEALSTRFRAVETVDQFEDYLAVITPEIQSHQARWGYSMSTHEYEVGVVRTFLESRDTYVWNHLQTNLSIGMPVPFDVQVDPPEYGDVQLTGMVVEDAYSGTYFSDVPVTLTALPIDGAVFVGWSDVALGDATTVSVYPDIVNDLTAFFTLDDPDITEIE